MKNTENQILLRERFPDSFHLNRKTPRIRPQTKSTTGFSLRTRFKSESPINSLALHSERERVNRVCS